MDELMITPLRTQADVSAAWCTLMGPLGFSGHSLWLMLIDGDDRPIPRLTQIEDCQAPPDSLLLDHLASMLAVLLEDAGGSRWALLRSRPGRHGVDATDRAWAGGLYAACSRAGVPVEVIHLATDDRLVPLPMDEVSAA